MPVWAKIDVHLPSNPKVKRARYWASQAYLALLLINKAHAFRGAIPSDYGAPSELVDFWRMSKEDQETFGDTPFNLMANGLRRCQSEKLIHISPDIIELIGWGPEWDRSDSSADRQKRYRDRKRGQGQTTETTGSDVTLRNGVTSLVTHNVTEGVHRGEERRREERRGEETPIVPGEPGTKPPPKSRKTKAQELLAKHGETAGELWDLQELLRSVSIKGSRPLEATADRLVRVCERLDGDDGGGASRDDCEAVLRAYSEEAKRSSKGAKYFNGETNWRPRNFDRTLGGINLQAETTPEKGGRAKPMARDKITTSGEQNIK